MADFFTRRGAIGLAALAAAGARAKSTVDFTAIEKASGGRLGCAVLDTGSGVRMEHRAGERFPMCSTFKLLASAFVLRRVDRGEERLDRRIVFAPADVVTGNSPVTKLRAGPGGMTVEEICYAAMTVSDNTAANLLLNSFGGPAGLTAFLRSIGDPVTRLDRMETDLNEAAPGDPRDTTTPGALVEDLRKLVLGKALSTPSRALLVKWMKENKTGDTRLRAGFPGDCTIGDKTGTGPNGTANDVAVIWPPGRAPIVLAAYLTQATCSAEAQNAFLADAGRAVARSLL